MLILVLQQLNPIHVHASQYGHFEINGSSTVILFIIEQLMRVASRVICFNCRLQFDDDDNDDDAIDDDDDDSTNNDDDKDDDDYGDDDDKDSDDKDDDDTSETIIVIAIILNMIDSIDNNDRES